MFRPLALFIGLRYTRAERSNGFISFISLISMIGLTLGVAVLITVLSVMNGFDRELKTRILGMVPQATVVSTEIIGDWEQLADKIKEDPEVSDVAPFIQLQGMLTSNGQVAGIMVTGVEPEYEKTSLSLMIIWSRAVLIPCKVVTLALYWVKRWCSLWACR
ncbi:hypothetical protein PKHYL_13550 [Psychrobacter sp. KH172YL61]|nr:hypothetical protein PKHYL_13550 [Psychrobacter sp. KH172YL61]